MVQSKFESILNTGKFDVLKQYASIAVDQKTQSHVPFSDTHQVVELLLT